MPMLNLMNGISHTRQKKDVHLLNMAQEIWTSKTLGNKKILP